MNWIITGIIVLAALALAAIFAMRAKPRPGSIHGGSTLTGTKKANLAGAA